jgi:hypothetical protein
MRAGVARAAVGIVLLGHLAVGFWPSIQMYSAVIFANAGPPELHEVVKEKTRQRGG